jgi:hypothetical protein
MSLSLLYSTLEYSTLKRYFRTEKKNLPARSVCNLHALVIKIFFFAQIKKLIKRIKMSFCFCKLDKNCLCYTSSKLMSVHLSTVWVRSHSIKCSEHASKLSGWKRYDFLKLVGDGRSTIRSDSGSKGSVTWSARDRASCFPQWIDTDTSSKW